MGSLCSGGRGELKEPEDLMLVVRDGKLFASCLQKAAFRPSYRGVLVTEF